MEHELSLHVPTVYKNTSILHVYYDIYNSFGITTPLAFCSSRKEIKYSFMHFCHLLTNIPGNRQKEQELSLHTEGKNNENYIHVLCNMYYPHCSLKHIIFCPYTSNSDIVEAYVAISVLLMQISKFFHQKF